MLFTASGNQVINAGAEYVILDSMINNSQKDPIVYSNTIKILQKCRISSDICDYALENLREGSEDPQRTGANLLLLMLLTNSKPDEIVSIINQGKIELGCLFEYSKYIATEEIQRAIDKRLDDVSRRIVRAYLTDRRSPMVSVYKAFGDRSAGAMARVYANALPTDEREQIGLVWLFGEIGSEIGSDFLFNNFDKLDEVLKPRAAISIGAGASPKIIKNITENKYSDAAAIYIIKTIFNMSKNSDLSPAPTAESLVAIRSAMALKAIPK
jgi:hypothetical protein